MIRQRIQPTVHLTLILFIIASQICFDCEAASLIHSLFKRDAYSSLHFGQGSNKLPANGEPCDNSGIIIKRSCTYEECLKYRYPNVGICRRWDEIEWSKKVENCHIVVNAPCHEYQ